MVERNEKKITVVVNGKKREASSSSKDMGDIEIFDASGGFGEQQPRRRIPHAHFKKKKKKKQRFFPKKRSSPVLKQVWASALTALGIGAAFGFLMLSMFTGEQSVIDNAQGKETEAGETAAASVEDSLEIAVSLIQGGAFKTIESANQAKDAFIQDGYAAVVDESEQPYRLYIGIGTKKDHLQTLISEYESSGKDIYVKKYEALANESMPEEEKQLLIEGKQLLLAFIMDTERLFNDQDIKDRAALSKKLAEWKAEIEQKDREIAEFAHQLQQTDDAIQSYLNENEKKHFWEAEQFIMEAFLLYQKMVR